MSFLDATGWTEAVLINLPFATGRKGDCMRYGCAGPGRRSEPQRLAGRSRGLTLCRGTCRPAPPSWQCRRDQNEDGAMGAMTRRAC